jgi:hypothetical protein
MQDVDRLGERSRAVLVEQRQRSDLVQVDMRFDERRADQSAFHVEFGAGVAVDPLADLRDQAGAYGDVGELAAVLERAFAL